MNLANKVGVSPAELVALTMIASGHDSQVVSKSILESLEKKGLIRFKVTKNGVDMLNTVRGPYAEKRKV